MKKTLFVIILLLTTPLFTDSTEELMKEAVIYNMNHEFKKAYDLSIKALEINPNDPFAYFFIGDYYGSLGKYKIALENYDKSIRYYNILCNVESC